MKKIIGSLLCLFLVFITCGCVFTSKKPISAEEFKLTLSAKGFTIQDLTYQFEKYDYIEKVYVAINEKTGYQVEFYDFNKSDVALSSFNKNKKKFQDSINDGALGKNETHGMFNKYSVTTGGKYKVVSRIEDTIVYLDVDETYSDELQQILEDLGY